MESGGERLFANSLLLDFNLDRQPAFSRNFEILGDNMLDFLDRGYRVLFLSEQEKQVERLLGVFREIRKKVAFEPLLFTLNEGLLLTCACAVIPIIRFSDFTTGTGYAQ